MSTTTVSAAAVETATAAATESTASIATAASVTASVPAAIATAISVAATISVTTAVPIASTISPAAVVAQSYAKPIGVAVIPIGIPIISIRIAIRVRRIAIRAIRSTAVIGGRSFGVARVWIIRVATLIVCLRWSIPAGIGLALICVPLIVVRGILIRAI
jgi:hypothetical protein